MALNPNVPVVAPDELITAAHMNAVRSNLDRLDTTKLSLTGGTLSGAVQVGGDPAAVVAGATVRNDGVIISRVQQPSTATTPNITLHRAGTPTADIGSVLVDFRRAAAAGGTTANIGSITVATGPGVAYVTTSDARLKTDVGDVDPDAVEAAVMALVVHRFVWNDDPDAGEQLGLFAQEAQTVTPDIVTPGYGEPGDPDFRGFGIDYSRLVPRLLSQMQHLTGRVATLEAAA